MIKTIITDGKGKKTPAEVTSKGAVRVATEPYHTYAAAGVLFQHPTYGFDINKNFSNQAAGNSNETIHDGTDSAAWTASDLIGTWDFAAIANPDSGTKHIRIINASVGDTAQFTRASSVTMAAHTGISGRLYITTVGQNDTAQLELFAWDTGTGTQVGNTVDLYDYVDTGTLLVYQTFNIPLADMGLTGATFDALRLQITIKAGAIFDMDNLVLNDPTGSSAIGTTTYTIKPPKSTRWLIHAFNINMAAAYAGTVPDGTMPNVPYDGFLGVPELASPMLFQVFDNGIVTFVTGFAKTIDFFLIGNPELNVATSDGTNTWMLIHVGLASPIVLNGNENDRIDLTLSDDLSGLKYFRFSTQASQQDLPEARA